MIIFFDDKGAVNGCLQAHPDVEAGVILSDNLVIHLDDDFAKRLADEKDPLQHYHLRVKNGIIEELSEKEKSVLKSRWSQAKINHKEAMKKSATL